MLTAISLAQTGKDLYGHFLPLMFSRISPQAPVLGMYWTVPFLTLLRVSSPFVVKIIYILPTLFFPTLVFELIYTVTNEKKLSLLATCVIVFSPWFYHISRLGVEAHLAYFFCLIGLILYLQKRKWIGVCFLIASYFSYFGIRPFIFVTVPYIELWTFMTKKNFPVKKVVFSIMLFLLLFGALTIISPRFENTVNRSETEVIVLNKTKQTQDTNFLRSISDAPFFMRGIFDNKLSVVADTVLYNFFKGLDFSYLFFAGDYVEIYANQVTGQFFPFLFVFFMVGIVALAKKKKAGHFFLAGFMVVGLASSLVDSYSLTFSLRSMLSFVGVGFIVSLGIQYVYEIFVEKRLRVVFVVLVYMLYLTSSTFFIYKYLFQNYKLINNSFNEQERVLADVIKKNNIQTIYVPNAHSYFLSYLSILPHLTQMQLKTVQQTLNRSDEYQFDGHHFLQCTTEQITTHQVDIITHSTLIESTCLTIDARQYIALHKADQFSQILSPQYINSNVERKTLFYFFK